MLVAIDAGHGGRDPGAVGRDTGLRESDVNMAVAIEAYDAIVAQRHQAFLTRVNADVFVPIGERVRLANNSGADVLVSIHCNAHESRQANGTETFHVAGSQGGKRLAEALQDQLIERLGRRNRGVKTGNWQIIRTSSMPAALIEIAFISNAEEEALLSDPAFRKRAALAICDGVLTWK